MVVFCILSDGRVKPVKSALLINCSKVLELPTNMAMGLAICELSQVMGCPKFFGQKSMLNKRFSGKKLQLTEFQIN